MTYKKINPPLIALWSLFGLSILFAFGSQLDSFTTVKTVLNYLSPALLAFVTYNIFTKYRYELSFKFFISMMSIYCFVGLVQFFLFPNFMTFLLADSRGVLFGGRGVISLTNEPAFYGTLCLFFAIFSMMQYNFKQNLIAIPLLLFQLFFLAKTTTAVGLLGVALLIFGLIQILKRNLKYTVIFIAITIISGLSINSFLKTYEDTRMGELMAQFINDPLLLTEVDQSAAVRLTQTFAPFLGIKENYFLPFGFGRYNQFVSRLYHEGKYRKLIPKHTIQHKDKIGGGINAVLFHYGFLGLIFPWAIFASFKNKIYLSNYLFGFILFILILFTVQLMHAMVGFIIGSALFLSNEESSPV